MEMHQVRYFLAVARTLNFTKAADDCNVAQPSLTRAIKQLEGELGGDLFRRERPVQLTELGQRMLPLLQQCFEAASGARSLAASLKSGEVGALRIALTHSIDLSLLIPYLEQIKRQFNRLELRFLRGDSQQVGEYADRIDESLREHGLDVDRKHEISSERDLIELVEADIGVAVIPHSAKTPDTLKRTSVDGLDARRTVHLYGVAGRERTAVASAVMRILRGADWQQFLGRNAQA